MRGTLLTNIGDQRYDLAFINNLSATVDPTVANDGTQGYEAGSTWINVETQTSFLCFSAATGAAVWEQTSQSSGLADQGAPAAKTTSGLLTAANLLAGIVTVAQGAGAASAQQLPTAGNLDLALPDAEANSCFDFSVINTSTVDAEDASLTTNDGWTLVGSMDLPAHSGITLPSSGRFRARKTGAAAWTLYRIA